MIRPLNFPESDTSHRELVSPRPRTLDTAILESRGEARNACHRTARAYARRIRSDFGDRFAAYQRLERLLSYPRIVNLLIRRANAGRYVRAQLEALINETGRPDGLLSLTGALRALIS